MFDKVRTITFVLAISIVAAGAVSAQVVTDGLVSYWSFDGGSYADAVGGHDGTLAEGDVEVVDGNFGDALAFDGTGAFVMMDYPEAFACDEDFSWFAWVNSDGGNGCIIALTDGIIDSDAQGAKTLMIGGGGPLSMDCGWVGGAGGTATVNDGEWHYVGMAVTIDAEADAADTILFYVDGELDGEGAMDLNAHPEDDFGITVGWDPRCGMEFAPMNGVIDDTSFYNRTLSADEIAQNYGAGALGPVSAVKPADKLASTWGGMKISH